MKILVLSDSHSSLRFMRLALQKIRPDAFIHLGDYYQDAQTMAKEFPEIPGYFVAGNCDSGRTPMGVPLTRQEKLGGVKLLLTHGHLFRVKQDTAALIREAETDRVQAVLYGHTHVPDLGQTETGLWVVNPGSSGLAGTAAVLEIENERIKECYLVSRRDLEE